MCVSPCCHNTLVQWNEIYKINDKRVETMYWYQQYWKLLNIENNASESQNEKYTQMKYCNSIYSGVNVTESLDM